MGWVGGGWVGGWANYYCVDMVDSGGGVGGNMWVGGWV